MKPYNYEEWSDELSKIMWTELHGQISKACNTMLNNRVDIFRFAERVKGEFMDKFKIVTLADNHDLSEREITTLLTYKNPLDKIYVKWKQAFSSDILTLKNILLYDVIDDLAEDRIKYILSNFETLDKGDKQIYFDRVMMCAGKSVNDITDLEEEENEDLEP